MDFNKSDIYSLPFQTVPNRHLLPAIGAVYFVISEHEELLYIGTSKDIRRRWKQHDCAADIDRPKLARIFWLEMEDAKQRAVFEKKLIIKFRPSLNWIPAIPLAKVKTEPVPSKKIPGFLFAKEVSEKYGVKKRVVLGWCERGLLPNAKKVPTGLGFDHWQIPETDLAKFTVPEGRGSPRTKSKSAAED